MFVKEKWIFDQEFRYLKSLFLRDMKCPVMGDLKGKSVQMTKNKKKYRLENTVARINFKLVM